MCPMTWPISRCELTLWSRSSLWGTFFLSETNAMVSEEMPPSMIPRRSGPRPTFIGSSMPGQPL